VLANGIVPLNVLESQIEAYIQARSVSDSAESVR
jgi:hypothetical protein